jgi:hypothetical protein
MRRISNVLAIAGLTAALAAPVLAPVLAQDRSADLTLSGVSVAAGVGYTRGDGKLHFQGKDYGFALDGLSIVDVGIARFDGIGDVYNLRRIEDFAGTYVAAEAGATVAAGGEVTALENQKGVRIYLRSTTQGLKLALAANGIAVALK